MAGSKQWKSIRHLVAHHLDKTVGVVLIEEKEPVLKDTAALLKGQYKLRLAFNTLLDYC